MDSCEMAFNTWIDGVDVIVKGTFYPVIRPSEETDKFEPSGIFRQDNGQDISSGTPYEVWEGLREQGASVCRQQFEEFVVTYGLLGEDPEEAMDEFFKSWEQS